MRVVLLTGGIASGKSTVAHELARLGAHLIDLDQLSREVLAAGTPTTTAVVAAFGHDLVDPMTGELDRGLLARRAFSTPEGAARLEAIELPAITARLAELIGELRARGDDGVCVVELALLDRAGELVNTADAIIAVCAPEDVRLARAVERGMDAGDAAARMANQPTDTWLRAHADVIIDNDGTSDELRARVRQWWENEAGHGA